MPPGPSWSPRRRGSRWPARRPAAISRSRSSPRPRTAWPVSGSWGATPARTAIRTAPARRAPAYGPESSRPSWRSSRPAPCTKASLVRARAPHGAHAAALGPSRPVLRRGPRPGHCRGGPVRQPGRPRRVRSPADARASRRHRPRLARHPRLSRATGARRAPGAGAGSTPGDYRGSRMTTASPRERSAWSRFSRRRSLAGSTPPSGGRRSTSRRSMNTCTSGSPANFWRRYS